MAPPRGGQTQSVAITSGVGTTSTTAGPNEPTKIDPYKGAILDVMSDHSHPDALQRQQIVIVRLNAIAHRNGQPRRAPANMTYGAQILSQWVSGQTDPLSLCMRWEAQLRALVAQPVGSESLEKVIDEHIEAILGLLEQVCMMISSEETVSCLTQQMLQGSASADSPMPPLSAPAIDRPELASHALVSLAAALTDNSRQFGGTLVERMVQRLADQRETRTGAGRAESLPSRDLSAVGPSIPETEITKRGQSTYAQGSRGTIITSGFWSELGSAPTSGHAQQLPEATRAAGTREKMDIAKGRVVLSYLTAASQTLQFDQLRSRPGELAVALANRQTALTKFALLAQQNTAQQDTAQQNTLPVQRPAAPTPAAAPSLQLMSALGQAGLDTTWLQTNYLPNVSQRIPDILSAILRGQRTDTAPAAQPAAQPSTTLSSPFAKFSGEDGHEKLRAQRPTKSKPRTRSRSGAGAGARLKAGASARQPSRHPPPLHAVEPGPQRNTNPQSGGASASAPVPPPQRTNPVENPPTRARSSMPNRPTKFLPSFQPLPRGTLPQDPVAEPDPDPSPNPNPTDLESSTALGGLVNLQHPHPLSGPILPHRPRTTSTSSTAPVPRQRSRKQKFGSRAPMGDSPGTSVGDDGKKDKDKDENEKKVRRGEAVNITRRPSSAADGDRHGNGNGGGPGGDVLGTSTRGRIIKASSRLMGK